MKAKKMQVCSCKITQQEKHLLQQRTDRQMLWNVQLNDLASESLSSSIASLFLLKGRSLLYENG